MTTEALTAIVGRALISAMQRHSKSQFGTVLEMPHVLPPRGDYGKVIGYFGLYDVAQDIAVAIEASLPKPCTCPPQSPPPKFDRGKNE